MDRRWFLALPLTLMLAAGVIPAAAPASAEPGWGWPVVGPVIRAFDPPSDPYGAGHRGIDIAAAIGTPVLAPAAGTVTFAGKVGGQLFVTLDHGGGLVSTYSWVSAALVRKNDLVAAGAPVALSGLGHPGSVVAHLHFGAKLDGAYVDPLGLLGAPNLVGLIHLAPLVPAGSP